MIDAQDALSGKTSTMDKLLDIQEIDQWLRIYQNTNVAEKWKAMASQLADTMRENEMLREALEDIKQDRVPYSAISIAGKALSK